MLFVLRLLPSYAKWQPKVVYAAFFLSFAVTMIATIMYGLACIPFRAVYESIEGSKCYSKDLLVIAAQVNGSESINISREETQHLLDVTVLSCVVDIMTATLPLFLLWGIQMRPRTKLILRGIFMLGLTTAAMSIGRAATTKASYLKEDVTCMSNNTIPSPSS